MFERIIVITKKTALEELLARHHSRGQVTFFLERRGSSIKEYGVSDDRYRAALDIVQRSLPRDSPREIVPRELVPNFLFRETDLVIALGPDGLAVNVIKYLASQPLLTVNPDPERIDGVLMHFRPEEVAGMVTAMLRGDYRTETITLAEARTNDGQTLFAVNDFLIGRRDQISARYTLRYGDIFERQSSSGVLVATGTGSTGWMRSVITGAQCIMRTRGEPVVPFPPDSRYLLFVVREPFPSKYTSTQTVIGQMGSGEALEITSEMPEGGAIFSDGVPEDAIEFNAGSSVTIRLAEKTAHLVTRTA